MGYSNLDIQSKILRGDREIPPLKLDVQAEYFTICTSPIEFIIEVIEGNVNAHTFKWELIEGPFGIFTPSSRTLFSTFNPIGNKARRTVRLTVDPGTKAEQIFVLILYDRAVSFAYTRREQTLTTIPWVNQDPLACYIIDANFNLKLPLFDQDVVILHAASFGNIIYVNEDITKVELFEYPSMNLVFTFIYPDTEMYNLDTTKRYLMKTWYYIKNIGWTYAIKLVKIINIYEDPLVVLAINDRPKLCVQQSESIFFRALSPGTKRITHYDHPKLVYEKSESVMTRVGFHWIPSFEVDPNVKFQDPIIIKKKPAANNSIRTQANSSSSKMLTLLIRKATTIG